MVPCINKLIN